MEAVAMAKNINRVSAKIACCPDATCDRCVRKQKKASEELRILTEHTRRRQFLGMVAARQSDGWQQ